MKIDPEFHENSFMQTLNQKEIEEKLKTFHKKHDEEMNYKCKVCNVPISVHNKDWHDCMCDNCFNKKYFSDSVEDPFSEKNSKGICRICNKEFSIKEIKKHLSKCMPNTGSVDSFLMKASAGPFWVYFSVPKNKTLECIDVFLRDLWLECCGHLSLFEINGIRYNSCDEDLEYDERTMNYPLGKILQPRLKLSYAYDFGTTSDLDIACISEIKSDLKKVNILARNNLPDFKCEICGGKAEEVCTLCLWDGKGFVCKNCSKKHKCDEPYFLPIVNSPRIGMCGFTGEYCNLLDA